MSRISIVQTSMSGSQAINSYFSKLAETSPAMAEYLKSVNFVPLIKECAENALKTLSGLGLSTHLQSGSERIKLTSYDKIGVISGSNDLLILMDGKGNIVCYGRAYESGTSELKRREKLFQQAFKQEVVKAAVDIMEYQVTYLKQEIKGSRLGNPELVMQLEVEQ